MTSDLADILASADLQGLELESKAQELKKLLPYLVGDEPPDYTQFCMEPPVLTISGLNTVLDVAVPLPTLPVDLQRRILVNVAYALLTDMQVAASEAAAQYSQTASMLTASLQTLVR